MKQLFPGINKVKLLLLFLIFLCKNVYSQKELAQICDDWKQQTANYVVEGYTSNNPDDYVWVKKDNQLQGIHIYVSASEIVPIYIQLNNNVINFSTRSGYNYAETYMISVKVSVDNSDYIELYSGSPKMDVVWQNSSDFFPELGDYILKLNIIDEFGYVYNREYNIKVIPASDDLYKDNFGNTLRVWKGNSAIVNPPIIFSEGFDAYDTNPQEMYYYAAQNLISCMNLNGYDVFLLDNVFGTQDIRNNAAVFSSAVRYISELYNNMQVIAGGVSMGGMIARYAFAKAEDINKPLPACVFISIDSPQQGAVISKPLQDYKKEHQQGDGFAEHALDNDAAKQLLIYNTYDPSGEIHNLFYQELNSLNGDGYPHNTIKNIGVSFSTNQPNPNSGEWLKIKWFVPIPSEETFDLTDEELQPGSYLPVDLTTTDPVVMIASYWWVQLVLPPIQPLYYPTIYFDRTKDPTYIPYKSALDIVNSLSKFDIVIQPNTTTHHDVLPLEVIDPIVTELVLIPKYIQNVVVDGDYSITGSKVLAGFHVTEQVPNGDVVINGGANLSILTSELIRLNYGVNIIKGANVLLKVDNDYSVSCDLEKEGYKIYKKNVGQSSNKFEDVFDANVIRKKDKNIIQLSPNPSKGKFTLKSFYDIKSFSILNSYGKVIFHLDNVNKKNLLINLEQDAGGIYYLKILLVNNEIRILKLIKL